MDRSASVRPAAPRYRAPAAPGYFEASARIDMGSCWHCKSELADCLDRCQDHAREMEVREVRKLLAQFPGELAPCDVGGLLKITGYSTERRKGEPQPRYMRCNGCDVSIKVNASILLAASVSSCQ